jgi:hypothetical protein
MEQPATEASPEKTEKFKDCLQAEIDEINKYRWYLGEQLTHDPLQDRSLNDIAIEWIEKYAAEFRRYWNTRKQQHLSESSKSATANTAPG